MGSSKESKLLDAFLSGGAVGSDSQYTVQGSRHNILTNQTDGSRALMEDCSWLVCYDQAVILATYAQARRVLLINGQHPKAEEISKAAEELGLYNTANTEEKTMMFCPLPCEDCQCALKCGVASEEARCSIALPQAHPDDGPMFF